MKSLARALMYGFFVVSTLRLVTGASPSATANGNSQSQTLTARAMTHTGGRLLIAAIGVVVVVVGVMLAKEGWTKEFLKVMNLAGAPSGTRQVVEEARAGRRDRPRRRDRPGRSVPGDRAIRFTPSKAEGIDGTLRAFARTPLGPVLLILVAVGLIAFGLFSCCEARCRQV